MMTRLSFRLCALVPFLIVLYLSVPIAAAEVGTMGVGTKTVREANDKVAKVLLSGDKHEIEGEQAQANKAARSLAGFLDIDELGRLALRDHWQNISQAQRTEFSALLRDLIETNYILGLRANLDYQVDYLGESKKGENLLVKTMVQSQRKGRPLSIEVEYLLRQDGKNWRTFDIITDGVGLVENYRAMFNNVIAKSEFDGLLVRMRKKLADITPARS